MDGVVTGTNLLRWCQAERVKLTDLATLSLTYADVGATAGPLPDGYHHLHRSAAIGKGIAEVLYKKADAQEALENSITEANRELSIGG